MVSGLATKAISRKVLRPSGLASLARRRRSGSVRRTRPPSFSRKTRFSSFRYAQERGSSCRLDWLPRYDRWRTPNALRLRIRKAWDYRELGLERVGERRRRQTERARLGYPNPVHRARLFERALAGGRRTYEEVAAEFGVTRAAVCQYLAIINRLPADAVRAVDGERDPARLRSLSMKALVRVARMGTEEAREAALDALLRDGASSEAREPSRDACAR